MAQTRDLRIGPPRRWSETVDGIPWLPRLIDKTRAELAGTLGPYLFGQSPMDRALLRKLGLSHRRFFEIVGAAADDDAVLTAIAARDPQALARARSWGGGLGRRHALFLLVLDIDDGYAPRLRPLRPAVTFAANALTWTIKRIWPAHFQGGNAGSPANHKAP